MGATTKGAIPACTTELPKIPPPGFPDAVIGSTRAECDAEYRPWPESWNRPPSETVIVSGE
jgi:hypothetical protein